MKIDEIKVNELYFIDMGAGYGVSPKWVHAKHKDILIVSDRRDMGLELDGQSISSPIDKCEAYKVLMLVPKEARVDDYVQKIINQQNETGGEKVKRFFKETFSF